MFQNWTTTSFLSQRSDNHHWQSYDNLDNIHLFPFRDCVTGFDADFNVDLLESTDHRHGDFERGRSRAYRYDASELIIIPSKKCSFSFSHT
jgi:hypothetical protein